MKLKLFKISLLLILSLTTYRLPLVSASFEQHSGSARPIAFGGAFTGLADSGDAMYYNPAGLAQVTRPEIMGGYSRLYLGLTDNSNLSISNLSVTYPFKRAVRAASNTTNEVVGSVSGSSSAGSDTTDGIRSDLGVMGSVGLTFDMFSLDSTYTESVMGIYYGGRLSKTFMAGVGLKYLTIGYGRDDYSSINPVFNSGLTKSNISVDAGLMALANEHISFGLSIRDANMPDMGLKSEDLVSRKITVGGAYRASGYNITSDISVDSLNDTKFLAGGEKLFMSNTLALRAGFGIGSRKYSRINTGIGYEGENIFMDYTFYYPLSGIADISGSHEATFGYRFGSSLKASVKRAAQLREQLGRDVESGNYSIALKKSNQCLEMDPGNAEYIKLRSDINQVISYLGASYKAEGKSEEAARKAISQYIVEKDVTSAMQTLQYAYSLNPDNESISKYMKQVARENNLKLEDVAKTWNTAEQKVFQALNKFKEKKYDEGIKLCEEAIALEPNNVTAYKRLGSIFYMLKDYKRAQLNWNKAMKLAPKDPEMKQIRELMKRIESQ